MFIHNIAQKEGEHKMSETKTQKIMKIIAEEREKRGLTYYKMAELIGCSPRAVSYWETGQREIRDIELADSILRTLGRAIELGK